MKKGGGLPHQPPLAAHLDRRYFEDRAMWFWCTRCARAWRALDIDWRGRKRRCPKPSCGGHGREITLYDYYRETYGVTEWPEVPTPGNRYRLPCRPSGRDRGARTPQLEPTHGTSPLTIEFDRALVYAARLYATQLRIGSGTPYLGHLLGVASLVIDSGASEEVAIAALLHDAVENRGGRFRADQIQLMFGHRVAEIVLACSDTDQHPKPPWRQRKAGYLARLKATHDPDVLLIAAADELHNARALRANLREVGDWVWTRFTAPKADQLWYYASVAAVLRTNRSSPQPMVRELSRTIRRLKGAASADRSSRSRS
jgi:hypothetical protein